MKKVGSQSVSTLAKVNKMIEQKTNKDMKQKAITHEVYCCPCQKDVQAIQIIGRKAYPHRADLAAKLFWQCPRCLRFVGSHRSGKPLGVIPTKQVREARRHIHSLLDPLWKDNRRGGQQWTRNNLYKVIGKHLGYEYHTAEIRTIEEAHKVWEVLQRFYTKAKPCPF